jgi:hypothetical protein
MLSVRTLIVDPLIPQSLWAALTLLSLAAVGAYVFFRPPRISRLRRAAVGVLLAIAVGSILALLLNPTWEELNRAEIGRPSLAVLLDTSGSMDTRDCAGKTRLDAAKAVVRDLAAGLKDQFNVRLWDFNTDLRALRLEEMGAAQATGVATDIGTNLCRALQADLGEEAAIVLLSDGIHNVPDTLPDIWKAAQTARTRAVPVFTKAFGTDASVADLDLKVVTPDDIAFVDQEVPVRARIEHPGFPPGTTTEVTLESGGKLLATQPVTFTDEPSALVEFSVKAGQAGIQRYVLEAKPLPQEIVRANNSSVFYLRVIDTPIRVLVLEGKPYWDTKFLVRDLVEAPGVTVKSAVRLKDGRLLVRRTEWTDPKKKADAEPQERIEMVSSAHELLKSFEGLKDYDIIILGRDVDSFLDRDSVENLCRWVGEWGGALVCARGRPLQVMPASLDRVMPVRWRTGMERQFRVNMTRDAEWMGWFPPAASMMPSLASDAEAVQEKPLATVLARSATPEPQNPMAVVTYQPYGSGRVIVLEGAGLWRWAFLPRGETTRQDLYPRFWNSLLRWLAASADFLPGETARLRASQTTFTELDQVSLYLTVRNDPQIGSGSVPNVEILNRADSPPPAAAAEPPKTGRQEAPRKVACVPGNTPGIFRAMCGSLPVGAMMPTNLMKSLTCTGSPAFTPHVGLKTWPSERWSARATS